MRERRWRGKRIGRGALVLASAMLLVAGCGDSGTEIIDEPDVVFDPHAFRGLWQAAPEMPGPRMRHSSALHRGALYVAGGIVGPGEHTASVIRLTPGADAWEGVAPMPYALAGMSLVVVRDTLFAVGGDGPRFTIPEQALFAYDADRDVWETRLPIPDQRLETEAVAIEERLWLIGGPVVFDGDHSRDIPGLQILEYTPGDDTWAYGMEIPQARVDHEAVLAPDGRLFLVGGRDPTQANSNAQLHVLDPSSGEWKVVADSFATHRIGATYSEPFLHVTGGAAHRDWHRALDTRDMTWWRMPRLPRELEWPQFVAWEGALWLVGGFETTPAGDKVIQSQVWRLPLTDLGAPGDSISGS